MRIRSCDCIDIKKPPSFCVLAVCGYVLLKTAFADSAPLPLLEIEHGYLCAVSQSQLVENTAQIIPDGALA